MTDRDAPVTLVEDHGYPLIQVDGYDAFYDGVQHGRRLRRLDVAKWVLAGVIAGTALTILAGRVSASSMVPLRDAASPRASTLWAAPQRTSGVASWYDDGPGLYAAVPSWRYGDRSYSLTVSGNGHSVTVTVRDFCGCPDGRVIDLSPQAFSRLAPLSRGIVNVTITAEIGPPPTIPPTDA